MSSNEIDDGASPAPQESDGGAAQTAGGAPGAKTGESLEAQLSQARAEVEALRDRYLRSAAELDNFRKRTVKMRSETRDETVRDVLLQVAPLLDNFRRALNQDSSDPAIFRQGIEIILSQFNDVLKGFGLEEIRAEGQPFDPNLHEALLQVPTDEHPPGTVMQEMEKGYKLNDRVVRPARVVVSAAKTEEA